MITEIKQDCLIGRDIKAENIKPITSTLIEYFEPTVGNIRVTLVAYNELLTGNFDRYVIAGITRNAFEDKKDSPLLDSHFIRSGYKSLKPPMAFKEKANFFLKFIYERGGSDNKKFNFNSTTDFTIAFAEPEEFIRIVEYLGKQNWIAISKTHKTGGMANQRVFLDVELTTWGIDEVEKVLPQIPLAGLVEQKIRTGNIAVDEKINHAKNLFFKDGSTMDDKRSACETLSYVLEPLRNELANFLSPSDISDFFQLVNRFDIRHNKSNTIKLIHEEQLEWIFYTLLNTINVFIKLKKKTGL